MQLQRIRVTIIILLFSGTITFGQDIYRLKVLDSTSFSKYNYFEFKKGKDIYKVISKKKDTSSLANLCLLNLEIKNYYKLNLEQILFLEDKEDGIGVFYYDVERMIFRGKNRAFGGPEKPVYLCDSIFKNQISCECLVDQFW
ncbi:MAG TPA: hypothetical protein PKN22_02810 [Taishania sp.]|nr:hypothetical protein [Taishania sp.]